MHAARVDRSLKDQLQLLFTRLDLLPEQENRLLTSSRTFSETQIESAKYLYAWKFKKS